MTERAEAHAFLLASGPPLARLAVENGPLDPYDWDAIGVDHDDLLAGLILHMVSQRISVKAALAVFRRLERALGGSIAAAPLARQSEDSLRALGVSYAKARAVIELARRVDSGELDLAGMAALDDQSVESQLTTLRGVGRWSPV